MTAMTFEHLLESWRSCPLESRERVFWTLMGMALRMDELPDSEQNQDSVTLYRLVAVMQNLPDLQDIEWLNAQRERAIERLKADIKATAEDPATQQVTNDWSVVDGDGLNDDS